MPQKGVACIYCFYNPATGKSYIGMTENEDRRFKAHHYRFLSGDRSNKLYCAMRKYSWETFEYRILAIKPDGASENWLINAERLAIKMYDSYRNGYNMTEGGETSSMKNPEVRAKVSAKLRGRKHPPEFCEKLRLAKLGTKHTEEAKAKMSASRRGKKQSPEHAAKRGLAIRGERNGMFGRHGPASPTFGIKRPDASEMNRKRVGEKNPRFGKKDTPETTAKKIAAQLARRAREREQRLASLGTPHCGPSTDYQP